jgi:excisionase family DNA binding protein
MTTFNTGRLLSREEAALMLNMKPNTLAVWKCTHRHKIPCVKVGRLVRYRYEDLLAFIENRTI